MKADAESGRELALDIVKRLDRAGFQSLWAGGCVRDLMLGQTPSDFDVATSATPDQVMEVLPYRAITVGISFGVVRVRHPSSPGVEVEVATFRSDGAYVDGRRPESIVFSSPELDASRRDFTINGMFLNPLTNKLIDYVGGQADLKQHVLRAIGDPLARLAEDKLRVLRGVRLAARFKLRIEPRTRAALQSMSRQVMSVSAERIAQELRRMLVHESRRAAMELALDVGLVAAILPPLISLRGSFHGTPVEPEGDLWDHTMAVLEHLPTAHSFPLAFAALLHDVGKPVAKANDRGRSAAHSAAAIADDLCRSLKLSTAERERVIWLVSHHGDLAEPRKQRDSKLKRILASAAIDELLSLERADALASTGNTDDVDYCRHYLEVEPAGPVNPPPLITGDDLVCHGLEPGAQFATLLEQVRDAQLDGQIRNKLEALTWVDGQLAAGLPPGRTRRREPPRASEDGE
jgi:poly(A) polymerase